MLPRSLTSLCLCMAALMAVSMDQGSCHQSFLRGASHHRFARRSSLPLSNLRRRSSFSITYTPSTKPNHLRRSIDLDQLENEYTSQSLDQQRTQAEKMWDQFVESVDGEDLNLYPDCEDESSNTSNTFSLGSSDIQVVEPLTSSSSLTSANEEARNSQQPQSSKGQSTGSNHYETQVPSGDTGKKAKDATKKKEAERVQKAKEDADAQAQGDKDAAYEKQQEAAEAKKEQDAAQAKQEREGSDARKAQANADAKKAQADADAKKAQADADAKKAQADADARKTQADADTKAQEDKAKDKEAYQVTNFKKIPGTSIITGTATRPKDETYASPASSEQHTGDATYFTPDTGACGIVNISSDYIVAVSYLLFDSFPSQGGNPNTNAICGKKIRASYGGQSVVVTVTDRCEGCEMFALDFTETAFTHLAPKEKGRLHGMTWTFI